MKPAIYCLEENDNNSQSSTLRTLIREMIRQKHDFVVTKLPVALSNDGVYVVKHENLTIGIIINVDNQSIYNLIKTLQKKNCNLIFCASYKSEKLIQAALKIEKEGNFKVNTIADIFNPFLLCNSLDAYKLDKLKEIIGFYVCEGIAAEEKVDNSRSRILENLNFSNCFDPIHFHQEYITFYYF
jgi:hypothetical protein